MRWRCRHSRSPSAAGGRPASARCSISPSMTVHAFVAGGACVHNCIGNSGPLKPEISAAVKAGDLTACSVLSGNRNFEGRVHPETRMNFLASPPLVVAYALAGTLDLDLTTRAARHRQGWQTGLSQGHLAERRRGAGTADPLDRLEDVPGQLRERLQGRCQLGRDPGAGRATLQLGCEVDLRQGPAVLRGHDHDAGAACRCARRARAGAAR